jgi:ABC-type multidrug transport system fused ATPase/permease subunit
VASLYDICACFIRGSLPYLRFVTSTCSTYFRAERMLFRPVIMCILQQALVLMSNLTLRTWGERNADDGNNRGALHYMLLYGLWILLSTIAGLVSTILIWVICGLKSARKLHDKMLHAVLRAPLSFFENTPTGAIPVRRTLRKLLTNIRAYSQPVLSGCIRRRPSLGSRSTRHATLFRHLVVNLLATT